jgi:hypothetical protein
MTLTNNGYKTLTFIWTNNSTSHKCLAVDSAKYINLHFTSAIISILFYINALIKDCYWCAFNSFELALVLKNVFFCK